MEGWLEALYKDLRKPASNFNRKSPPASEYSQAKRLTTGWGPEPVSSGNGPKTATASPVPVVLPALQVFPVSRPKGPTTMEPGDPVADVGVWSNKEGKCVLKKDGMGLSGAHGSPALLTLPFLDKPEEIRVDPPGCCMEGFVGSVCKTQGSDNLLLGSVGGDGPHLISSINCPASSALDGLGPTVLYSSSKSQIAVIGLLSPRIAGQETCVTNHSGFPNIYQSSIFAEVESSVVGSGLSMDVGPVNHVISQPYIVEYPSEDELQINPITPSIGLSPISAISVCLKSINLKRSLEDDSTPVERNKCRKLCFDSVEEPIQGKKVEGKSLRERKRSFRSVKKYLRHYGRDENPDITTLLLDTKAFKDTIDLFVERYRDKNISVVAGVEARGFIFGPRIALAIGAKFVPMRKPNKLPGEVISEEYSLEYGTDKMKMHVGAVEPGQRALVIDDLIATRGTLCAAIKLLERVGVEVFECACVIELPELKGQERLGDKPLFVLGRINKYEAPSSIIIESQPVDSRFCETPHPTYM
ncbi:hypothetical protein K1719_041921 [Acacia pycnantha]|nr:hypothetical protein K1719_041921 [Acacia pycnantha]